MALLPFECCGTSCDYSGRLGVDGRALVAQESVRLGLVRLLLQWATAGAVATCTRMQPAAIRAPKYWLAARKSGLELGNSGLKVTNSALGAGQSADLSERRACGTPY